VEAVATAGAAAVVGGGVGVSAATTAAAVVAAAAAAAAGGEALPTAEKRTDLAVPAARPGGGAQAAEGKTAFSLFCFPLAAGVIAGVSDAGVVEAEAEPVAWECAGVAAASAARSV